MRPDRRVRLAVLAALFALAAGLARAEVDESLLDKDIPPPPPLDLRSLVPLEVAGSGLQFGVDPRSVSVGRDSVVRYVVVASSPGGAVNAMYEGLRCDSAEYRLYARHSGKGDWQPLPDAPWRPFQEERAARHTLAFARAAACMGRAPAGSPSHIMRDLARPEAQRLR